MITTFKRKKALDNYHGCLLATSQRLLLLLDVYDFQADGYVVIRQKDVKAVIDDGVNRHISTIMRKERLLPKPDPAVKRLNIDDWPTFFADFPDDEILIVESEPREMFAIGFVDKVGKKSMVVHHFDGCGDFIEFIKIKYSDITVVRFGSRYCSYHQKYLNLKSRKINNSRRLPPQTEHAQS